MAVMNETKQGRGGEAFVTLLGVLTFLAIAVMAVTFWFTNRFAEHDRQYIGHASDIRVLSQQIAKNASEAANGKTDAFSLLRDARDSLQVHLNALTNGVPGALPATKAIEGTSDLTRQTAVRALNKVERPWGQMNQNVEAILERWATIVSVNELADRFRVNIPKIQAETDELIERLIATKADADQIKVASRQLLLAEQIGRNIGEMLAGGIGNMTAAERLGRSTEQFARGLNALRSGSSEMGVSRVTDSRAQRSLGDIAKVFNQLQVEVEQILEQSPELFRVRDAADAIFITSEQMLATSNWLIKEYSKLQDLRLIKDVYGIAAGGAALILLVLIGLFASVNAKRRVSIAHDSKQMADEEAERNQHAIIELLDEMQGLSEGDLTAHASVSEAFTGAIADAFNSAIDALRKLVMTINETSVQVSSAAQQTQATAMHLAEASDHQAHQITAASAAINEMAVSIDQVSKNSEESANVAQKSVDLSSKGAETVRRTISGMDAIREQIQETSKRIKRLGESSQEIGNIVELINDIADQTNILALNASIQAAMAGEAGRGFAVVADEVQRLAERSSSATKQIEALVKTIQTDTNEAVISMEQSTAGVVSGAKLAEDAGEALREIESVSTHLANLIQNISEAARQQANAAANISDTMNVIQEITSQTSAGTNETATSIGNLADLANELRNSVAGFKLPE